MTNGATAKFLCGLIAASGLLAGCGDSQQPPTRYPQTLGGKKEGAPLPRAVTDLGVLQDQTAYTPAKRAGGGPGTTSGATGRPAAATPDTQVRLVVDDLANFINSEEVELALKLFVPEQVAELLKDDAYDPLYDTLARVGRLRRALRDRGLAASKVQRILAPFGGGDTEPKRELRDPTHATVSPSPARVLFGPVRPTDKLSVIKQPDGWRFEVSPPLTAEDVEAILGYHQKLYAALGRITDWAEGSESVDEDALRQAVEQAVEGKDVSLPGGAASEPPAPEGEPKPEAEQPEGRPSEP